MKPSAILTGIAFISIFLIASLLFVKGFADSYSISGLNTTAVERLNKMSDVQSRTAEIQNKVQTGTLTTIDTFVLSAKTVFEVLKLLLTSPLLLGAMVLDIGEQLNIPAEITGAFLTIVVLLLVLGLVRVLKGVGGGDI